MKKEIEELKNGNLGRINKIEEVSQELENKMKDTNILQTKCDEVQQNCSEFSEKIKNLTENILPKN